MTSLFKLQPKGTSFDNMPFYFEISRSVLASLTNEFKISLSETGVTTMGAAILDDRRVGLFFDTKEEMDTMKIALLKCRLFQLGEFFIW
jgi:hypothetical protein